MPHYTIFIIFLVKSRIKTISSSISLEDSRIGKKFFFSSNNGKGNILRISQKKQLQIFEECRKTCSDKFLWAENKLPSNNFTLLLVFSKSFSEKRIFLVQNFKKLFIFSCYIIKMSINFTDKNEFFKIYKIQSFCAMFLSSNDSHELSLKKSSILMII